MRLRRRFASRNDGLASSVIARNEAQPNDEAISSPTNTNLAYISHRFSQ